MLKILFIGNGPYVNRGCEAIVRGTLSILEDNLDEEFFIKNAYFSKIEDSYLNFDLNINKVSNYMITSQIQSNKFIGRVLNSKIFRKLFYRFYIKLNYRELIPLIKKSDVVFAIGGDNHTLDYGFPAAHLSLEDLVHSYNKPLIIWGVTLGFFSEKNDNSMKILKKLKTTTSLIIAREFLTTHNLIEHGYEEGKIKNLLDPAFYMKSKIVIDNPICEYINDSNVIGINLSPIMGKYAKQKDFDWDKTAKWIIEYISMKYGYKILLIPHVDKKANSDYKFMKSLNLESEKIHLLKPNFIANELKWIISKCYVFVGCRTHSTIASLSSFVPTICIGYSLKARGINELLFDSVEYLTNIDDFSFDSFIEKIDLCIKNRNRISEELKLKISKLKKVDRNEINDILKSPPFNSNN